MFTWLYAYAQPTAKLVLLPSLNPDNYILSKTKDWFIRLQLQFYKSSHEDIKKKKAVFILLDTL